MDEFKGKAFSQIFLVGIFTTSIDTHVAHCPMILHGSRATENMLEWVVFGFGFGVGVAVSVGVYMP